MILKRKIIPVFLIVFIFVSILDARVIYADPSTELPVYKLDENTYKFDYYSAGVSNLISSEANVSINEKSYEPDSNPYDKIFKKNIFDHKYTFGKVSIPLDVIVVKEENNHSSIKYNVLEAYTTTKPIPLYKFPKKTSNNTEVEDLGDLDDVNYKVKVKKTDGVESIEDIRRFNDELKDFSGDVIFKYKDFEDRISYNKKSNGFALVDITKDGQIGLPIDRAFAFNIKLVKAQESGEKGDIRYFLILSTVYTLDSSAHMLIFKKTPDEYTPSIQVGRSIGNRTNNNNAHLYDKTITTHITDLDLDRVPVSFKPDNGDLKGVIDRWRKEAGIQTLKEQTKKDTSNKKTETEYEFKLGTVDYTKPNYTFSGSSSSVKFTATNSTNVYNLISNIGSVKSIQDNLGYASGASITVKEKEPPSSDSNLVFDDDGKRIGTSQMSVTTGNAPQIIRTNNDIPPLATVQRSNEVYERFLTKPQGVYDANDLLYVEFSDVLKYNYAKMVSELDGSALDAQPDANESDVINKIKQISSYDNALSIISDSSYVDDELLYQFDFMTKVTSARDVANYHRILRHINGLDKYAKDNYSNYKELFEQAKDKTSLLGMSKELKDFVKFVNSAREGLYIANVVPWTTLLTEILSDANFEKIKNISVDESIMDYRFNDDKNPLVKFFSLDDGEAKESLSSYISYGKAISACYIPLRTNVYLPQAALPVRLEVPNFLKDFHLKYGFYRKALFIDTNDQSLSQAKEGEYVPSKLKVATLNDLTQYKRDVCLYIDDNYYNYGLLTENYERRKGAVEMTRNAVAQKIQSFVGVEDVADAVKILGDSSLDRVDEEMSKIVKDKSYNLYSEKQINGAKQYGEKYDGVTKWFKSIVNYFVANDSILSDGVGLTDSTNEDSAINNEIKSGIEQSNYSWQQPFAIVSAIYRKKSIAEKLNKFASKIKPVFVSSDKAWNIDGSNISHFNTLYNYMMISNLMSVIEADDNLKEKLDKTLYMDVYGNILLDDGTIVIPAASNSTLYSGDNFTPTTFGLMHLYSQGNRIKMSEINKDNKDRFFTYLGLDSSDDTLALKVVELDGKEIVPSKAYAGNDEVEDLVYKQQVIINNSKGYDFDRNMWLITEVMRGAPIEHIDETKEGISIRSKKNKYTMYLADKVDLVADTFLSSSNGNTLVSMPNLAFLPNIEVFFLLFVKLMIILAVAYIIFSIYLKAVAGKISFKEIGKSVLTILLFVSVIVSLPKVISLSYNEPNKILLQDHLSTILLHNLEKLTQGKEITATGVRIPKTETKFYIKLNNISIPWYNFVRKAMVSSITDSVKEMYKTELESNPLFGYTNAEVVADGVYIDLDKMFDSSTVAITGDKNNHYLYQNPNNSLTASYFSPYYFYLDVLIDFVNKYNRLNGIKTKETTIGSDGNIKTTGLIKEAITSEQFLEEIVDPLNMLQLYELYDIGDTFIYGLEEIDKSDLRNSLWYVRDYYTDEELTSGIDKLYSYMRRYISNNRNLIDKVSDENFLKVMALQLALKHNSIFKIPYAKNLEVFNIDTRDIIKASITKNDNAVLTSYSFGRFVMEQTGALGLIITFFLLVVYFVLSLFRPILVIAVLAVAIYNFIIKKIVKRESSELITGFVVTSSIIVIANVSYSFLIKISLLMTSFGINGVLVLLFQLFTQITYLVAVVMLSIAVIKNPEDMGNEFYKIFGKFVVSNVASVMNKPFSPKSEHFGYRRTNKKGKELWKQLMTRDAKYDNATEEDIDDAIREREREGDD